MEVERERVKIKEEGERQRVKVKDDRDSHTEKNKACGSSS